MKKRLDAGEITISTHALREEGDLCRPARPGIRPIFLPTPSARRATPGGADTRQGRGISTHALREEGDPAPSTRA